MNGADPIVLELDDRPVQAGVKRSNAAIDDFGARTKRTNQEVGNSFERMARQMEQQSRAVQSLGNSFENSLKALAAATRGATEFGVAMLLGAKAISAQVTATSALEAGWNRVRVARVGAAAVTEGLGGALVVGSEIAAVLAIEKVATAAYARSKDIQSQALAAQRSGFSYEDRSALDFTAQRAGRPLAYYDSAVKSAGGVQQLAKSLRELADVKDPIARAEVAFKEFGPDADRVLASLGDRFGDNAERAKSWGVTLDDVSRSRIDSFRRDIDAIRGTFDSFSDSLATTKRQLGALFELDLSSIFEIMTRGPGTLWNAVRPPIAFSADTLDTKGAQRDIQARSSTNATALAQQEMLRTLTPGAEKQFQKDQNDFDNEASLRAEIKALQDKLFISDRSSRDYGKLGSGAQFPGGYGAQAESLQKYTSDQGQLARVLEAKKASADADEAAKKAAQELASAQRSVASGLQSAQLAELSGADKLRAERDNAIKQYGLTKQLISDINKEFSIRFGIEGKALINQSDADMRTRAAAEARSQESQLNARTKYTSDAILNTIRISGEAPAKRDDIDLQSADVQRESQLRQLESMDAKTLAQKQVVEAAKFQIESNYFTRVQDLEAAGIDRSYQRQLQDLQVLVDAKLVSQSAYNQQAAALNQNEALDQLKLAQKTQAEIEKAGIASAKAVREEYQREFSVIQGEASHLLDTLFTDPKHFGKQLSETIRAAFLKPVISGLSNDIAKSLQPVIYGPSDTSGGGFSFSKMADSLGIRQSTPQQDWSLSAATKQGVLAGYSKFTGTPVYNAIGNKNSPLGEFDPASGTINMYASAIKGSYSSDEIPWGAARTFIHEDAHSALDSKNINALNAMLPQEFVKQSIQGLVKSNHYSDSDAAREVIPRLVTNEDTGASGFNQQKIFQEFIGTLQPQDAKLATTLRSMGQTTGAFPRALLPNGSADNSDAPSINDLLRSTQPLNDYRISAAPGSGFGFPTSGPSSSGLGVPTGVSGLNAVFGDNPTAMLGGGASGFAGGGWGGFSSSRSTSAGGSGFLSALPKLFGGSTAAQGGQGGTLQPASIGKYLSGLKGNFWNENINTGSGSAVAASSMGIGGDLAGVLTSPGAASLMTGVGQPLAMAGLTGNRRGTWGGVAEATGGGALTGAGIGTMVLPGIGTAIGAGIGAAAGFAASTLEMVTGVESPQNKAIKQVKQAYGISIDKQMANQIVQIANSKYAQNISLAVHSPEVRQMLQLYSAGTGQAKQMGVLNSGTPMGGSLVEQGGQLYQGQNYQFGNAYVQQSSLATIGGGNPSLYPNAPTASTIQLDGPATTALLSAQVVNVANPAFVQSQFAASQMSSNGRVANAATVQQPGLITS